MKKSFRIEAMVLAVLMLLSVVGVLPGVSNVSVAAETDETTGGGYEEITTDDGLIYHVITDQKNDDYGKAYMVDVFEGVKNDMTVANVASSVTFEGKEYPVISIGDDNSIGGFNTCQKLEKIVLPDTIERICRQSIVFNPVLKEINLPDSISYLGPGALLENSKIESIVIPQGVKNIYEDTFFQCKSLKEVIIHPGVTYISDVDVFPKGCHLLGLVNGIVQHYCDAHKEYVFQPVDGVRNSCFQLNFPSSWIGKYYVEYGGAFDGEVGVYSAKCYEENKGGCLFAIAYVHSQAELESIADYYPWDRFDGQASVMIYTTTETQTEGCSAEAIAEYEEMLKDLPRIRPNYHWIGLNEAPVIPKVKAAKNVKGKKIKVTVTVNDKNAKFFEYEYSTDKDFKKSSIVTSKKKTVTIKKLKKGKTYYVRARSYYKASDGCIYSDYSDARKVGVKK